MTQNNFLKQKHYNMARIRRRTKTCTITGLRFPIKHFYKNNNTEDGYHPYSKVADNFRRRLKNTNVTTMDLRDMFNNLNLNLAYGNNN